MSVRPIPEGYHSVTPYLVVRDVEDLLEFAGRAFGAEVIERMARADGAITHAEFRIGDSIIMAGLARDEASRMPAMLYVYLADVDAAHSRAVEAGGTSISKPADQFYGDRVAAVSDQLGNQWWMATHVEDVSPEELQKRAMARAKPGA